MPVAPLVEDDRVSHPLTDSQYADEQLRTEIWIACVAAWKRDHPGESYQVQFVLTRSGRTLLVSSPF
jgi:hypothetical protein